MREEVSVIYKVLGRSENKKKFRNHHCHELLVAVDPDDDGRADFDDGGGGYHGLEIRSRRGGDDLYMRAFR